jgi:hypothetical protein
MPGIPPPEVSRPNPLLRRTLDPDIWHGLGVVCKTAESEQPFRRTSNTHNGRIRTVISAEVVHPFRAWRTRISAESYSG